MVDGRGEKEIIDARKTKKVNTKEDIPKVCVWETGVNSK